MVTLAIALIPSDSSAPACLPGRDRGSLDQLEAQVEHCLGRRMLDFRLLAGERGLVLRGRAPTYYVKQLVQHAVMKATNIPIMANEIAVA
jgi:hypothetical protein